jgi:hypothetical protein
VNPRLSVKKQKGLHVGINDVSLLQRSASYRPQVKSGLPPLWTGPGTKNSFYICIRIKISKVKALLNNT